MPAREIQRRYHLKMFGFVRNPWERLVSLYAHLCQDASAAKLYNWERPDGTFKNWLMCDRPVAAHHRLTWGDLPPPRQPQSWWLDGCRRVGRYEHLQADLNKITRAMDGLRLCRLERTNGSRHGDYRRFYDEEAKEAVAAWHAADIARWGYSF